jgi:hypothetical protein
MSYLDVPRLHFFGSFFANPSTNNNDPANYEIAEEVAEGVKDSPTFNAPLWNPNGSHTFMLGPPRPQGVELPEVERYFPCTVTGIATGSNSQRDHILGATVRCPNYALLVDLDADQQWVSQIIGSTLRIEKGADAIIAKIPTINFVDIFSRVPSEEKVYRGKDSKYSAAYQTVLTDVEWSEWPDSEFVHALRAATSKGTLSIRFVLDGYHTKNDTPLFRYGRLAGTIGPWHEDEPRTFVNARYLRPMAKPDPDHGIYKATQWGNFNYAPAKRDLARKVITFDLGNAIPTIWPSDADFPRTNPELPQLSAWITKAEGVLGIHLGDFDLSQAAYETNAYVQEFALTGSAAEGALWDKPTAIFVSEQTMVMSENQHGAYANFDQYVFRLNKDDTGTVDLWANLREQPAAGAVIPLSLGFVGTMNDGNGYPANAIQFPTSVTTDEDGRAQFRISAGNPAMNGAPPREFIDGQVYAIVQKWQEDELPNPNIGVSVKIFNTVTIPDNPTWTDIFPILNQFRWLYPVMADVVGIDLSDYESVKKNKAAIRERIQLPFDDTGYMPITRELSRDKTQIIVKWIDNGCPK